MTPSKWKGLGIVAGVLATLAVAVGMGTGAGSASSTDSPLASCPPDAEGLEVLSRRLRSKEATLQLRSQDLDAREADLRELQGDLKTKLDDLAELQRQLEVRLESLDEVEMNAIKGSAKRLEGMKSVAAAAAFAQLYKQEPETAVAVLERMNKIKASKMLTAMPSKLVATIEADATEPFTMRRK